MIGYIYLINLNDQYYKIGFSRNPKNRVNNLFGVKVPIEKLELEHVIKVTNMPLAEKYLHQKFEKKRTLGEWFRLDIEDIFWFKSLDEEDLYYLVYGD